MVSKFLIWTSVSKLSLEGIVIGKHLELENNNKGN